MRFTLFDILNMQPEDLIDKAKDTTSSYMHAAKKAVDRSFPDMDETAKATIIAAYIQAAAVDYRTSMIVYLGASFASILDDLRCIWLNQRED